MEKRLDEVEKLVARKNQKQDRDERDVLLKVKEYLSNNTFVKDGDWKANEIEILNNHLFITSKPAVFLVNISEDNYKTKKNKWLPKIQ